MSKTKSEVVEEIRSKIYDNNEQAITGDILQGVLVDMVDIVPEEGPFVSGDGEGSAVLSESESVATGEFAVAEGYNSKASGNYSHAEGKSKASGSYSHAEGNSTAEGNYSHAEGGSTASGAQAHAEGNNSIASGANSHAEGYNTTASAAAAHAEGSNTVASGAGSHAEGRFNVSHIASTTYGNAGNTQHSVGIGTADNDRKNAFEIMENGDAYLIGVGGYDGTNPSNSTPINQLVGQGYQYAGLATVSTNPDTPEGKIFYVATQPGTYSNFGGLVVAEGEVAILKYDGTSWSKDVTSAATKDEVSQLGQEQILFKASILPWAKIQSFSRAIGTYGLYGESTTDTHKVIPVFGGQIVRIKRGADNSYWAILKSYTPPRSSGTIPDYANGESARYLNGTNIFEVTMPDDAQYIVVNCIYGGTNRSPSLLTIDGYDVIKGLYNDLGIADGAVTTPKIADGAVTTPKIADGAVTIDKVQFSETDNNLVDSSKLAIGYLNNSGIIYDPSPSYKTTDFIAVVPGSVYYLRPSGSNYNNMVARFVCLYDSSKNFISGSYVQNLAQITIPSGASYLRASYYMTWFGYEQITKDAIFPYEPFKMYISPDVIKPIGTNKIQDGAITEEKLSTGITIPTRQNLFNCLSVNGSVNDAIYLSGTVEIIKNACVTAIINGEITDNGIAVGLGYDESVTGKRRLYAHWVVIKPTVIEIYRFDGTTNVLINTYTHGLTLTNKTFVYIIKNDGNNLTAKIKISTDLGDIFQQNLTSWYAEGKPFMQNYGNTSINGCVSLMPMDLTKKVWLFGDSYLGFWSAARWPYYLMEDGNLSYLVDALAGASAADAYVDLTTLLTTQAIPVYLVWCLGMNGPADTYDSQTGTYVINATQKQVLDDVVALCAQKNIQLILAKIPSVPNRRHTGYNQYVESLGLRYIDFDSAVGAQPNGTWNDGLLSSDNEHPTEAGAKVLYAQAIVDCPELTIKE